MSIGVSTANSQSQLSNAINFNPSNIIGSSNDTGSEQSAEQSQTQETSDKADVGVSLGLGGAGGNVGLSESIQEGAKSVINDLPFGISPTMGLGLMTATFVTYMIYKNYKPKKKKA